MRNVLSIAALAALALTVSTGSAAEISGEYLEARTCDVYTGPCFANGEMTLTGKEAVMAWKVEQGGWQNVSLDGLNVALVVAAEGTLGDDGVFPMEAGRVRSVILVDKQATDNQRDALVAFVRDAAGQLADEVVDVKPAALKLENNHLDGRGVFEAGEIAKIETRALKKGDCVCTNEIIFYQPLTEVDNSSPAYVNTVSYRGEGLNAKWTSHAIRGAFLGTFRR